MIHSIYRIFRLKTLTSRLCFTVILLICLSSSLHLFSYMSVDKSKRIEEAKNHLDYALTSQRLILESWAEERAKEIRDLANMAIAKERQLERMHRRFQTFLDGHEELASIVFLDENGYVIIDSASKEGIIHSDVSLKDRAYFIAAKQGEEYMHDVVLSRATETPVIIFSAPVMSHDNEFQGVIFGAAHLSKVNDMLNRSIHGESGEITLINQDGVILTHLSKEKDQASENDAFAAKLKTEIAESIFTDAEVPASYLNGKGNEVFGAFVPLYDGRYFLINEISKKEVLQSHYQMIVIMLAMTAVIVIAAAVMTVLLSKHFVQPLIHLVKAMKKIEAGNYLTQLTPHTLKGSPLELQQLMNVFNEMTLTIQKHNEALEKLSRTDELTGVANRRVFDEYLEKAWLQASKEQTPLSLAFIDIDLLEEINDTYGHQTGDHCLKMVAQALTETVQGPGDAVVRYGGDEFVLILPETDRDEAVHLAEKARSHIEKLPFPRSEDSGHKRATVSIGVASTVPSRAMDKETLIRLADQALYEAKSRGRNKVQSAAVYLKPAY